MTGRYPVRPLRILVTGSRNWDDRDAVIDALIERDDGVPEAVLVHGGARGADTMAANLAEMFGWAVEAHPADWARYGKSAGFLRNVEMVSLGANICVVFALKWASGSGHCARAARRAGIPTIDIGVSTRVEDKP